MPLRRGPHGKKLRLIEGLPFAALRETGAEADGKIVRFGIGPTALETDQKQENDRPLLPPPPQFQFVAKYPFCHTSALPNLAPP